MKLLGRNGILSSPTEELMQWASDDLAGIVMQRKTSSPVKYTQQIGVMLNVSGHQVFDSLYEFTCPECGRKLLLTSDEIFSFKHSNEFCVGKEII